MITLITGVPGSGKTAYVVQMIMEELKKKRRIYSIGIPDLVASHCVPDDSQPDGNRCFAVEDAGNPRTWQKGSWLKIQSYELPPESEDEFDSDEDVGKSAWVDNEHKESGYSDYGSLIIIDEAQTFFRPRSSASKVPDYIAAFEVHRHQGLDFWILTQRPNLLDGNLRGLVSRHIHIHTSSMGKRKIEWAECQNPDSRQARGMGNSVRYKPNPKVFDLYRSAQLHTKFKIKLPNTVYILGACFVILCASVAFLYFNFAAKLQPKSAVASSVSSPFLRETSSSGVVDVVGSAVVDSVDAVDVEPLKLRFDIVGHFASKKFSFYEVLCLSSGRKTRIYFPDYSIGSLFDLYQGQKLVVGTSVMFVDDDVLDFPSSKQGMRAGERATREARPLAAMVPS